MRLILSMGSIFILLIISFNFNLSFPTLYNHTLNLEKREPADKQMRCLQVATKAFFTSLENLYVVGEKAEGFDIYRFLYKYSSFTRKTTVNFESKSISRYIIIENEIPLLIYMFQQPDFSTSSEYLIMMKTSFENLSGLADYLYNHTFVHVAFWLVDDADDVTVYQYKARPSYEDTTILVAAAKCDDYFLMNKDAHKSFRKFAELICPVSGCSLNYWKLVTDLPNEIIYKVAKNGTAFTDGLTNRKMKLFADHYKIQKIHNANETNIDISWKDAAQAVLNRTVDVLCGHTLPEPEEIEDLAVVTYVMSNSVGMMYVQKVEPIPATQFRDIFAPFDIQIWLCLIIVFLFYGLFICAVERIHKQHLIREYLHASDLIRIFMKQDIVTPTNGGLRIIVGLILVFALILTIYYESMIASSFIARIPSVKFETLEDLVKSGCRFGGPKYIRRYFKHPANINGTLKSIYDRYEVAETEKIIQMMYKEGVVMMHNTLVLDKLQLSTQYQEYSYLAMKQPLLVYPIMLFTSKGHPYTSILNHFVLILEQSAIDKKSNEGFTLSEVRSSEIEKFRSLSRNQFAFCWNILIIGWSTSLVTFLAESIAFRFKR